MKNLILLLCFVMLFACKASSQTTSSPADTVVWGSVQTNFPGGQDAYNRYVADSAIYPKIALDNHVMGCSYIRFTIEKDGSPTDVRVFRGVGSGMDEAAVKLIRHSGKWIPSQVNGAPVKTRCKVAVNYELKAGDNNNLIGVVGGTPAKPAYLTGTNY